MPMERKPLNALAHYLPPGSLELVLPLLEQHKVHLTITRERQTKLGDYRNAWGGKNHRISVNGNLNPFAFLITLLHELAHLLAFEQYGLRIQPHGHEWKHTYSQVLRAFLQHHIFPADIAAELHRSAQSPAASSCAEDGLQRILRRYNVVKDGTTTVEELPVGAKFMLRNGRTFVRGEVVRKRIKCVELPGNRQFLFSPLYEVMLL